MISRSFAETGASASRLPLVVGAASDVLGIYREWLDLEIISCTPHLWPGLDPDVARRLTPCNTLASGAYDFGNLEGREAMEAKASKVLTAVGILPFAFDPAMDWGFRYHAIFNQLSDPAKSDGAARVLKRIEAQLVDGLVETVTRGGAEIMLRAFLRSFQRPATIAGGGVLDEFQRATIAAVLSYLSGAREVIEVVAETGENPEGSCLSGSGEAVGQDPSGIDRLVYRASRLMALLEDAPAMDGIIARHRASWDGFASALKATSNVPEGDRRLSDEAEDRCFQELLAAVPCGPDDQFKKLSYLLTSERFTSSLLEEAEIDVLLRSLVAARPHQCSQGSEGSMPEVIERHRKAFAVYDAISDQSLADDPLSSMRKRVDGDPWSNAEVEEKAAWTALLSTVPVDVDDAAMRASYVLSTPRFWQTGFDIEEAAAMVGSIARMRPNGSEAG